MGFLLNPSNCIVKEVEETFVIAICLHYKHDIRPICLFDSHCKYMIEIIHELLHKR